MIWFAIIASLLLHLLSGFAIVILFQRISFYQTSITSLKDDLQEAYASMEVFVEEIAKSNDELYDKITNSKSENSQTALNNSTESHTKQTTKLQENNATFSFQTVKQQPTREKNANSKKPSKKEKYEQISHLLKQGYTEGYILKEVRCTIGEIQLIQRLGTDASGALTNEN